MTVTSSAVTGLGPAPINYTAGQLASLTVNGGGGNDTFTYTAGPLQNTTYAYPPGNHPTIE